MKSSIICCDIPYNFKDSNGYTLCISNKKEIFFFGKNTFISEESKKIDIVVNIKMIDCYSDHVICLDYDENIYSFGNNDFGQLGIGKNEKELKQTHIPQKINIPSCKQVSCGDSFTICLTDDNRLFSFGKNNYGQLGLGNNSNYSSPQLISDLNNIDFITCSGFYCFCKTYNNEYYSWGNNFYGQLGNGNNDNCNKPIQCLNWPDNIIDIKCGNNHTLLLTSEGHVYGFGKNVYGNLGLGSLIIAFNTVSLLKNIPEIQRIECGDNHSMCIDINKNLWLFGENSNGQLGLGNTKHRNKPIQHPTLSNIIDISSGGNHTFVKTIDNKIYAFGYNKYSQLGIKTSEENQLTPIQVFQDNEDIWCSFIGKSKQKSARK